MEKKTLVFSIAMNGYQLLYKEHLKTHKEYAIKHHYEYIQVNKPSFTNIGNDCCWLKLTLILEALESGYNKVLFVDSDAKIHSNTPPLEIFDCDKSHYLYMAKGYTGRFNSGVIIIKNHKKSIEWIRNIINHYNKPIPENDSVGWGENGHIIHFSKNISFIKTLNTRWNNTFDPNLNDYIRHYNHGPLRNTMMLSIFHLLISRASKMLCKLINIRSKDGEEKIIDILSLSDKVCKIYPIICHPNFSK